MKELIAYGPIILVCIPFIMTILLYQVHFWIKHNKWKAIHFSVQYSVCFYILAVIVLLNWIFTKNFLGIILVFLILVLSIILIIQWKSKEEVYLLKGLVVLSRFAFLVFALTYVGLLTYVVITGYLA